MQISGLAGRTALITGASKGIGRASARALARAGANVVVNHRDSASEAETRAESIRTLGRRALVVRADVGVSADVGRLVGAAIDAFGGVDVAVHSAYFSRRAPVLELEEADWDRTLDVCLKGAFLLAQHVARNLVRREMSGSIIFISSIQASMNPALSVAYNTAKNGLNGLAFTLANELAPHQIRVNVIEPGWIDTPGERKYASDAEIASAAPSLPWGRLGTPEEIANAVLFLASELGSYVSGASLRVDGALWLQREPRRSEAGQQEL